MTAVVGLAAASGSAFAQSANGQMSPSGQSDTSGSMSSKSETLTQCIARQKENNSSMTHAQAKSTCKSQMKTDKTHPGNSDSMTESHSGTQMP